MFGKTLQLFASHNQLLLTLEMFYIVSIEKINKDFCSYNEVQEDVFIVML